MTFDTLLIPTDGSDPAEAAARRGFDLAAQLEASVHVLSVADSSLATGAGYSGDSASIRARLRERADSRAASLRADADERGLDATAVVRDGIPAKEIVDYADEQGLDAITLGTSGRGGVARAVAGSVADKVVRTATVPVLTLNRAAIDDGEGSVDSILLPTDGSEPSEAAAAHGGGLAEQLDATVHCFSVVDEGIASGFDSLLADDDSLSADRLAEQADDHVDRVVTTVTDCDVEYVSTTATGDPAEEIIDYADDNGLDMIVMGTHGRGGFQRAVVGSVTDEVVRTASVPVLTVRAETSESPEETERRGNE
ncbi:universal stress protein [Natrialba sp. INN-245]|uniref:universal stress protein n=1 Tax=Natrialba sp. INN-245 TaxID=2690967 RepID=UPI001313153D|nr:universal stress protein [Natrialba sp. INN-245]MWV41617.1 universal stress protein [Natrialba sp. INN-245]